MEDKVKATAVAGAVASSLSIIIVWWLGTYGNVRVPELVSGAGITLVTLGLSALIGWFTPESTPSESARATVINDLMAAGWRKVA